MVGTESAAGGAGTPWILGASIGNCVHVAGVIHFLALAEAEGYATKFMGPATPVGALLSAVEAERPDIVAVSYRLTPEVGAQLLSELAAGRERLPYEPRWVFGGTKPVADIARSLGFFDFVSDGYDDISDSVRFLRGVPAGDEPETWGSTLADRVAASYPYPVLRHHYGRPTLEETVRGVREIAESKALDVISLGTDQNAQQFFFRPEGMDPEFDGAGGVPVRSAGDFESLKAASRCGNYPLMRCYSGTEDVGRYAEMLLGTIDNAWAAIPLCWYNELDGRGGRTLRTSLGQAQALMRWHAERGVPVEVNEPHHWGLRDAHDVIPVAMAYIAAYNAKRAGVSRYIAQYMFNNPNGLSFSMDLAKVLAMIELAEELKGPGFMMYRETRAGLALFNADPDVAKGQLAASTLVQMSVRPHIVHVVGYCEADHAATAEEVIASCRIARGVIRHSVDDRIALERDERVIARKEELLSEARYLLDFIRGEYSDRPDPLANPDVLTDCVERGYIDAVHIQKGGRDRGTLKTTISGGMCVAVDPESGRPLTEEERLSKLGARTGAPLPAASAAVAS